MAKKVAKLVKLQVLAGKATPAPPVGPALGQAGVNIMAFVKEFKERADVEYFARLVDNSEIMENDYNLSVYTYVEKEDTREIIDIKVLNKEIEETVKRIDVLRASINEIVKELENE